METCDTYNSADWYEFAEGDLHRQNRDQMKRHLDTCPHCREQFSEVESVANMLEEARPSNAGDLPDQTEERILDTARREARPRRTKPQDRTPDVPPVPSFAWREFLFGATAAAAVLLMSFVFTNQRLRFEPQHSAERPSGTEVERKTNRPATDRKPNRSTTIEPPSKTTNDRSDASAQSASTDQATGKEETERSGTQEEQPGASSERPRNRSAEPKPDSSTQNEKSKSGSSSAEQTDPKRTPAKQEEQEKKQTQQHEKADSERPAAETEEKSPSGDDPPDSEKRTRIAGDVNNDGRVDVVDSMLITKKIMKSKPLNARTMDVNGDGRVTLQDARLIMKKTMSRTSTDDNPSVKTY